MKRAFLQEPTDSSNEQPRPQTPEATDAQVGSVGSRRVQTSVAVLGLALSFGASGGILSKSDSAFAAEASVPSVLPMAQAPSESALPPISMASSDSQSAVYHVVHEGESLWTIAKEHNVDVQLIKLANSIAPDEVLKAGQVLRLPVVDKFAQAPLGQTSLTTQPSASQTGSLKSIGGEFDASTLPINAGELAEPAADTPSVVLPDAQKSTADKVDGPGTENSELAAASSLQPASGSGASASQAPELQSEEAWTTHSAAVGVTSPAASADDSFGQSSGATPERQATAEQTRKGMQFIAHGQLLQNSQGSVSTTIPVNGTMMTVRPYQVKPGDTFWSIASRHGVASEELLQYNPDIQDPDSLKVGAQINVPVATVSQASSAPVQLASTQLAAAEPVEVTAAAPSSEVKVEPRLARARDMAETAVVDQELVYQRIREARQELESQRSAAASQAQEAPKEVELASAVPQTQAEASETPSTDADTSNLIAEVRSLQRQRWNVNDVSRSAAEIAPLENEGTVEVAVAAPPSPAVDAVTQPGQESEVRTRSIPENMLAAAPMGIDSYLPSTSMPTGQTVSPGMPILPDSGEFLPDAPDRFEGYVWPTQGVFTSGFGWRWGRMHNGVDIAGPVGTPVVAAASGVVIKSGWNSGGYGNLVDIRHADGSFTRYAHNSRLLVREGQQVRQGQQIAEMGSTGYSTGPHLHFEVHLPSSGAVNPMAYLPGR